MRLLTAILQHLTATFWPRWVTPLPVDVPQFPSRSQLPPRVSSVVPTLGLNPSDDDVISRVIDECFRTGKVVVASRNDDGSVNVESSDEAVPRLHHRPGTDAAAG
jgi:hypothetical protein